MKYFRYVKDVNGKYLGGISLLEHNGDIGLGISICNFQAGDVFSKFIAKSIANEKSEKNLNSKKFTFLDVKNLSTDFLNYITESVPKRKNINLEFIVINTLSRILNDLTDEYSFKYYNYMKESKVW